jgi:hypothetical protein
MKKISLIALFALSFYSLSIAQRDVNINQSEFFKDPVSFIKTERSSSDTLMPLSASLPCASVSDSLTILTLNPTEWVFGCNSYGDLEGAQVYDIGSSTFSINNVICFVQKMGVTGTMYAKIYTVNSSTNAPENLIATSLPKHSNTIPSNPMAAQVVNVDFDTPVIVSGKFAVAIEWFYDLPNGSAMGLASSRHECTVDDTQNSWIKDASGTWFSSQSYSLSNQPLLTDLYILPVGNTSVGLSELPTIDKAHVFPIPAQNKLNISFSKIPSNHIELSIINLQAVKVVNQQLLQQANSIDISGLEDGIYFYQLTIDGSVQETGKIVVGK